MERKTLAEHTADVLRERGETRVDIGDLDVLAEAYSRTGGIVGHPLDRNQAVTRALAHTVSGKRLFRIAAKTVMYPGIINTPVNVFELRDTTRDTDETGDHEH